MPSFRLLAASCLVSYFASMSFAAPTPESSKQLEPRQGCVTVEPNDPNCLLPFYTDTSMNLTFDDIKNFKPTKESPYYFNLEFTNFTVASPDSNDVHYLRTYDNSSSYARLHADYPGFIDRGATAFFKIETFWFGCSVPSPSPHTEKPMACILTVEAICANSSSGGIEYPSEMTYTYPYIPSSTRIADLAFADMHTYGVEYACYNYTLSATGADDAPAVLFLDQVQITQYENDYFD